MAQSKRGGPNYQFLRYPTTTESYNTFCRKVQESKDELQTFVKQFVAGKIEENSAEVDTKLRHIERDVLRKSSKDIKASLDHVDNQMRAKRDDINIQMEQVASSITDDKVTLL